MVTEPKHNYSWTHDVNTWIKHVATTKNEVSWSKQLGSQHVRGSFVCCDSYYHVEEQGLEWFQNINQCYKLSSWQTWCTWSYIITCCTASMVGSQKIDPDRFDVVYILICGLSIAHLMGWWEGKTLAKDVQSALAPRGLYLVPCDPYYMLAARRQPRIQLSLERTPSVSKYLLCGWCW